MTKLNASVKSPSGRPPSRAVYKHIVARPTYNTTTTYSFPFPIFTVIIQSSSAFGRLKGPFFTIMVMIS